MYKETNLTADFAHYYKKNPNSIDHTCAIEFKCVNTLKHKRLNFKSDIRPHQIPTLIKTAYHYIYHKLSDLASFGGNLPFDSFILKEEPAYLAVLFYQPRKPKLVHFLPVNTLASLKLSHKSLTEEQCAKYAQFTINISHL